MATSGVRSLINNEILVDTLKKHNGNVRRTAQELNVTRDVIYDKINQNPELKKLLDKIRHEFSNCLLDRAVTVADDYMNDTENPRLAVDIAKFIMEKKGHERGLGKSPEDQKTDQESVNQMSAILQQITRMQNNARNSGTIQPETD